MSGELLCLDDVDPYARELSDPLTELEQDLFHRLLEDPDSNLDAIAMGEQRGLGLEDLLSTPLDPNLAHLIKAECELDDRVTAASALITEQRNGNGPSTVTINITVDVDVDGLNAEGYAITIVRDASGLHLVKQG
ncbi:MAG TPA: hypothetical protein VGH28_10570 [Polyangiaceae bacterium]|jgi:succinate dehydrogenase flavin-adding protein (antitoxin of CptAB toxin-antitoxin module)